MTDNEDLPERSSGPVVSNRPLSSVEEVRSFLEALPRVKAGHRRVLRGQRQLYPTLKPAELRQPRHPRKLLFKAACHLLATQATQTASSDGESLLVWTEVIAQHYGPGSRYLDVTTNIDVALWFALNELSMTDLGLVMGSEGPLDSENDFLVDLKIYVPGEPTDTPGYLMVLDLPIAASPLDHRHGAVIDLSDAPQSLSDSSRIAHQRGLLAWADEGSQGGDLSGFLAHDPVQVDARLRDEIEGRTTLDYLFPSPPEDPWYHRLLSIPLVLEENSGAEALRLAQAVPVALYARDYEAVPELTDPIICLQPPLLAHKLRQELGIGQAEQLTGFFPEGATVIILEEPLFLLTPPIDSGQWFEAVGVDDLPRMANNQGGRESVQLERVYLEFSPLELTNWHDIESSAGRSFQAGAYLDRANGEFRLWSVLRTLPKGEDRITGPLTFLYDNEARRFVLRDAGGVLRDAHAVAPFYLKTLLLVLGILRDLSQDPIPALYSFMVVDETHLVALTGRFTLKPLTFKGLPVFLLRSEGGEGLPDRSPTRYGIGIPRNQPGP